MSKTKIALLVLAYLLLVVMFLPAFILLLIGAGIIYVTLLIEKKIVREVDEDDLKDWWMQWVESGYDVWHEFIGDFLKSLEV